MCCDKGTAPRFKGGHNGSVVQFASVAVCSVLQHIAEHLDLRSNLQVVCLRVLHVQCGLLQRAAVALNLRACECCF